MSCMFYVDMDLKELSTHDEHPDDANERLFYK